MNPLRKIGRLLIAGSALAGNWIGVRLRATTTGEAEQSRNLLHTTINGQTVLGLNIPLMNFVPALVLALLAGGARSTHLSVARSSAHWLALATSETPR
jgi:hypothetical protein